MTLETAAAYPPLVAYLHKCFADEVASGMTYPQEILQGETYTQAMFEGYFFAVDVLVAITGSGDIPEGKEDGSAVQLSILQASKGRTWEDCVAGVYYVKPNYPGRSSHVRLCDIRPVYCPHH